MKIVVISDTHVQDNNCSLPEKLQGDIDTADMVIHAGDYVSYAFVQRLQKLKNFHGVYGNMDSPEIRKVLPQTQILKAGKFKIALLHGAGTPEGLIKYAGERFKDVDAVIFGHSHSPVNETINGVLYFNPGTPTEKFFAQFNSYGILEVDDKITAKIVRIDA